MVNFVIKHKINVWAKNFPKREITSLNLFTTDSCLSVPKPLVYIPRLQQLWTKRPLTLKNIPGKRKKKKKKNAGN